MLLGIQEDKFKCKGLFYRAHVSNCKTKNGFGLFIRLSKLKKISCPGCQYCVWENDYLGEINNGWPVRNIKGCQDRGIYRLTIGNETTDFETGYIDQWDLVLVPTST